MFEVGHIAYSVLQAFQPPGRWLFVKIFVLGFCIAAVGRLIPWTPVRTFSKRSRRILVSLWAVALLALGCFFSGTALVVTRAYAEFTAVHDSPAYASLTTKVSSYLGVYEPGAPASYDPVERFSQATKTRPGIALYYSTWGLPFQQAFAATAYSHHVVTLIQMMPSGPGVSMAAIARGADDSYLKSFAASVRDFRHPVIMGFAPEMNGNWYSWGYTKVKPATWVAAWRHVVTVFRSVGADNVTWLWTSNQVYSGSGPLTEYWPGNQYVNWVGIDAYFVPAEHKFSQVIIPTLKQIRRLTDRPVIISETGVAPGAGKPAVLEQIFAGVRAQDLLGFVYFDGNQQEDADYHYRWRLEDSQSAVNAYGLLARQNATLPHPAVLTLPEPQQHGTGSPTPAGSPSP